MQNSAILGLQPPIRQFTNPPASGSVSHGLLEQINAKSAPGHMPPDSMGGTRPFVQCNFHVSEEFYPFFLSPTYLFPFIWLIESLAFGIFHCRHERQAFN